MRKEGGVRKGVHKKGYVRKVRREGEVRKGVVKEGVCKE